MRQNFLTRTLKYSWVLVLAVVVFASSCKDDPIEPEPIVVEDGWYVKGAGTALVELDSKGLMKATKNEVGQADRATLLELFVAVKGGSDGFSIVNVVGGEPTSYGGGTDFAVVPEADRDGDEPKVDFWRGSYVASETAFTVTDDGLYHVVIDTELEKVVVVPVVWGVIGAATPGGWGSSTAFTAPTFDLNAMTFTATDLTMLKGEWKFRYSEGWKVEIDTMDSNPDNHVKVNTNFGSAIDALVPGGDNIVNDAAGVYSASMVWTLGAAQTATMEKTGNLPPIDYSAYEMGLIGNCYLLDDGITQAAWDVSHGIHAPVVSGTTYTWTWANVELNLVDGQFKVRQGTTWDEKSIGYDDCVWEGAAAGNFSSTGGNMTVSTVGTYTLVLVIDATTETYTMIATQ